MPRVDVETSRRFPATITPPDATSVEPVGQVAEIDSGTFWLTVNEVTLNVGGLGIGCTIYITNATDPVTPLTEQTAV